MLLEHPEYFKVATGAQKIQNKLSKKSQSKINKVNVNFAIYSFFSKTFGYFDSGMKIETFLYQHIFSNIFIFYTTKSKVPQQCNFRKNFFIKKYPTAIA